MRKALSIAILLLAWPCLAQNSINNGEPQIQGPMRVFGNILQNISGYDGKAVTETTGALTLYVRSDGNDSSNCTADAAGQACLTIQAAVNKIPTIVKHQVTVNIGAGNFAGFMLANKLIQMYSGQTASNWPITIQGATWTNFTPATGTGSGTSDGGSTTTLVHSTQTWTAHDLRGKVVYVNSGYLIIRDNDATSLETIGASTATMSGKAYVLKDWATVINDFPAGTWPFKYVVAISNMVGTRALIQALAVDKIKIVAPATAGANDMPLAVTGNDANFTYISIDGASRVNYGTQMSYNTNIRLQNIYVCNILATKGIELYTNLYIRELKNIFVYNVGGKGMDIDAAFVGTSDYIYTDSCGGNGVELYGLSYYVCNHQYAKSCAGFGLLIYGTSGKVAVANGVFDLCGAGIGLNVVSAVTGSHSWSGSNPMGIDLTGTVVISNSTGDGLVAGYGAVARVTALTGTGNGNCGIVAGFGAKVFITSATTVTGTGGGGCDVKLNATTKTYAGDFSIDGDYETDATDGTIVKRSDAGTF